MGAQTVKKAVPGPQAPPSDDTQQRSAFAHELRSGLDITGRRQSDLMGLCGVTSSTVSYWCSGRSIPDPDTVFAIEDFLGTGHNTLSRHLGYARLDPNIFPDVRQAIAADAALTARDKRTLLDVYEALIAASLRLSGEPTGR